MTISRDRRYGMMGKIRTVQVHPWECVTNYAALVALRCNVDVQDLRRVLPPHIWISEQELELEVDEVDESEEPPPQRYHHFSLGDEGRRWGWMGTRGCLPHRSMEMRSRDDWQQILANCAQVQGNPSFKRTT